VGNVISANAENGFWIRICVRNEVIGNVIDTTADGKEETRQWQTHFHRERAAKTRSAKAVNHHRWQQAHATSPVWPSEPANVSNREPCSGIQLSPGERVSQCTGVRIHARPVRARRCATCSRPVLTYLSDPPVLPRKTRLPSFRGAPSILEQLLRRLYISGGWKHDVPRHLTETRRTARVRRGTAPGALQLDIHVEVYEITSGPTRCPIRGMSAPQPVIRALRLIRPCKGSSDIACTGISSA